MQPLFLFWSWTFLDPIDFHCAGENRIQFLSELFLCIFVMRLSTRYCSYCICVALKIVLVLLNENNNIISINQSDAFLNMTRCDIKPNLKIKSIYIFTFSVKNRNGICLCRSHHNNARAFFMVASVFIGYC